MLTHHFEGGDPNLYGYVLNDPVNLIDSTGKFTPLAGGAAGIIAGGIGTFVGTLAVGGTFVNALSASGKGALLGGSTGFLAGLCGGCAVGVFTGASFDAIVNAATGLEIVNNTTNKDSNSDSCN